MKRKLKSPFAGFRSFLKIAIGPVLLLVFSVPLFGAENPSPVFEKLHKLPPKEREKAVVEGAKKEGEVMWYLNWERDEAEKIIRAFKKKYPFVNVLIFRGGSGKVDDKLTTEYRAGRHLVDIILAGTSKMLPFKERGIIGRYLSSEVKHIRTGLFDKEGWWTGLATGPVVIGTNSQLVPSQEAPGNWSDLLSPKWRGKIGLDTEPDVMILGLLQAWGEEKTLAFIRGLAQNQPQLRGGHTLLVQLLAAGEFPVAAELYGYRVADFISKGAPIRMSYPNPTIYTVSPIMMARFPPHPHAAALFYDFLLSEEAQTTIGMDIGRTPARRGVKSRNPEFASVQESEKFLALDPWFIGTRTRDAQRWIKEIFLGRK